MFLIKLLYAILGVGLGISIVKYRKIVYEWTGRWYWAEKYIGSGGTVFVITMAGLGLIFVSMCYPFWVFDNMNSSVDMTRNQAIGGNTAPPPVGQ